jgi:penicillin-binding protein-related factor A (putative recombinase)
MTNSGKYFERQFVNSFNKIYPIQTKDENESYIIRLKDSGSKMKRVDVADYLVFFKNVVFNSELKARKKGILYLSSLNEKQINKWKSFSYKNIRIPLIILKDTNTKKIAVFFKKDLIKLYSNNKLTINDSTYVFEYNNSDIPYNLDVLFSNIYIDLFSKETALL